MKKNWAPFISKNTLAQMKERNDAQQLAQQHNTVEHWRHFRSLRNTVNKLIKTDKQIYFTKKFTDTCTSTKQAWSTLNTFKKQSQRGPPLALFINNAITTSPSKIVKEINNFFLFQRFKNL